MTIKEGRELIKQLQEEIKQGVDVEINKAWIKCLNKSILNAIEKGYTKAMKNLL